MPAKTGNPIMTTPGAFQAVMELDSAMRRGGVPETTAALVHLRASQINSCGVCVDMHARTLRKAGESDERIASVAAWRDAPYYTAAERAALALAEAGTRLADRTDPVPDTVWDDAAEHYDDTALKSLVLEIAVVNMWNRVNAMTHQTAGEWQG
jgi:AhpD family alkylhydroperoxidase